MERKMSVPLTDDSSHNAVDDSMIDPVTGEYAVIAQGHTAASVTQKISSIVLTSHTPLGWFYLPSSWGTYRATPWDYMLFAGTMGIFGTLFLLFVRFAPMIPMNEIKAMLPQP